MNSITKLKSVLIGAAIMAVSWSTASLAATCATCHAPAGQGATPTDFRPVDAAYRNITTGGFKGSHTKHIPSPTTTLANCTACHGASVTSYTTKHRDGNIQIDAAITYSKGASFAQSGDPTLGSCSNASCHANVYGTGTVTTPVWGATAAGCTACHTTAIATTGPATGSHVKHNDTNCADCHTGATSSSTQPSTNHIDGNIDVANGYPANVTKHTTASGFGTATCSTASCHANVYGTGTVTTPVWGATAAGCTACHTTAIATTGPATGSHALHNNTNCADCHTGATNSSLQPTANHIDGNIDVTNGYPANVTKHAAGSGYSSCSTAACHGSSSPVWGANTTNNTCTKCHGTGTVTVTATNRYVVAPSDPAATDTGKVSANAKIGAHQTHLQYFNGLSQQGTDADARCQVCHGALPVSGNHANGSSAPAFQGLAKKNGTAFTATYTAGTSTCAVYCHNPAGTGGTLSSANAGTSTTPAWNNPAYIADGTLKTDANCNKCHLSPGNAGFTAAVTHTPTINQDCAGCHGHNGGTGGVAGQQHIDGIKYGSGSCNNCHGYPPLTSAQLAARVGTDLSDAKVEDYAGGAGYHSTHLLATVKIIDGFTPCLPCHPSSTHNQGGGTVSKANVNVNDDTNDTTYRFDSTRAKRYNKGAMTCSNISCHFQPTPSWNL